MHLFGFLVSLIYQTHLFYPLGESRSPVLTHVAVVGEGTEEDLVSQKSSLDRNRIKDQKGKGDGVCGHIERREAGRPARLLIYYPGKLPCKLRGLFICLGVLSVLWWYPLGLGKAAL